MQRQGAGGRMQGQGAGMGARAALTCGGSAEHGLGQQQQGQGRANAAHGSGEPGRGSTCRGAAGPEPEHRNSSGAHRGVRMKLLRRSALRLNEGPRDSSCDGIKQRCMILSSASFSSCAYDSLSLLSALPGISERPVWSHTIHPRGIFILVLRCDQFLYLICF